MKGLLSDHLKAVRDDMKKRRSVGLIMMPGRLAKFIARLNTLVAMAEEQEAELRLALIGDRIPDCQTATLLRFPTKVVMVVPKRGPDDAA